MDPRYPVGKFSYDSAVTPEKRKEWICQIANLPIELNSALASLPHGGLDRPYRDGGWTARQVVHHLADSHLNAHTRMRNALTEDKPLIKTYEESEWAKLPDAQHGDPSSSLAILDGLHKRFDDIAGIAGAGAVRPHRGAPAVGSDHGRLAVADVCVALPSPRRTHPAAGIRLGPGAEVSSARFEQLADRDRGVNQADVCVRLRKVAEQAARVRVDVLGEQPERIGVSEEAIEERRSPLRARPSSPAPRPTRTSRSRTRSSSPRSRRGACSAASGRSRRGSSRTREPWTRTADRWDRRCRASAAAGSTRRVDSPSSACVKNPSSCVVRRGQNALALTIGPLVPLLGFGGLSVQLAPARRRARPPPST